MSNTWLCIPSARPPEEAEPVLKRWKEQGYQVALWRDDCSESSFKRQGLADCIVEGVYPGYARAVNHLVQRILNDDSECDWLVTGGDDVLPDPRKRAEEIARECSEHFAIVPRDEKHSVVYDSARTFGVMQPTGDRWHEGKGGFENAPIDRVCGSPWMGREFCRRMYGGKGPLFEGYQHQFVDEELQEVALKLGVLWQRRDLTHKHMHWGRGATDQTVLSDPKIPPHLEKWNTTEHWQTSKRLFTERKAAGFPGHEPI